MPGGPDNVYKRPRGRPPNDPAFTAESFMDELKGNQNPILAAVDVAFTYHRARKFAETSAALTAAVRLLEYAQSAAQLDLFASPLETCDCGHPRAMHVDGSYCSVCLSKINGDGFHGCKAFKSLAEVAKTAGPRSLRCNCGRTWTPRFVEERADKNYPRTHTSKPGRSCYELRPDGVGGRMIRHSLDVLPVEVQNEET